MARLYLLCCLVALFTSALSDTEFSETGAAGRGPRPVEAGQQGECKSQKEWPFCSDDDWGPKCPSGCRIEGLMNEADRDLKKKIDNIRKLLEDNRNRYKNTRQTTENVYGLIREKLLLDTGNDDKYGKLADDLRRRIVDLRVKIINNLERLAALKNSIRQQVNEMNALEVDIDIKIRACKGSCANSASYNVDRESYVTLDKQLTQLDTLIVQRTESSSSMRTLKMRRVDKEVSVPEHYKLRLSKDEEGSDIKDIVQYQMSLERLESDTKLRSTDKFSGPGLSGTGMEVSGSGKVDTKETLLTDGSAQSSSSTTHTQTITCKKTIRRKITMTEHGPVETIEVVGEGTTDPQCAKLQTDDSLFSSKTEGIGSSGSTTIRVSGSAGGLEGMTELFPDLTTFLSKQSGGGSITVKKEVTSGGSVSSGSRGQVDPPKVTVVSTGRGDGDFINLGETDDFSEFTPGGVFPGAGHAQAGGESSSYYTKTVVSSGSSKGDYKSRTALFSEDFQHDEDEDDMPDIKARSLKKDPVKLMDGYVGTDCEDIQKKHASGQKSGLFQIKPEGTEEVVTVYCDQDTILGGWLLVQQRMDGSVEFNRTWEEYRQGFGSVDQKGEGEVWLGNKYLHLLTQKESILRIELEDWSENNAYAEYLVHVGPESDGYSLKVSKYEGDAGDALIQGQPNYGQFTSHMGMKFSTYDRDNDKWEESCAAMYGGGWWYNNCQAANLNGVYYQGGHYDVGNNAPNEIENGVVWLPFKPADYSLKVVKMKIRPVDTQ
ncbi:LOW QUALITY PROTEIN: fibrinogen alpha chain [Erpetoichthys calabaricus]|uniref:LOW QUALITY PROTEIN: fibrinogen alpha chain n=1 Tax=Erpetoichthys calabaricus TaxID=27687 RepID=UPI0022340D2A|nr:LOW QUALITY PROTEIN: fibrinogen alpha chain [Erpetoichthys calabaricus]